MGSPFPVRLEPACLATAASFRYADFFILIANNKDTDQIMGLNILFIASEVRVCPKSHGENGRLRPEDFDYINSLFRNMTLHVNVPFPQTLYARYH